MDRLDRDEPVKIDVAPEDALRIMMGVDPEEPAPERAGSDAETPEAEQPTEAPKTDERCPVSGWGAGGIERCIYRVGHTGVHQYGP